MFNCMYNNNTISALYIIPSPTEREVWAKYVSNLFTSATCTEIHICRRHF